MLAALHHVCAKSKSIRYRARFSARDLAFAIGAWRGADTGDYRCRT
jgi:hypothetical protein